MYGNSPKKGRGNAWVRLLDNPRAHDANRNGDMDLSPMDSAEAWDSAIRDANQAGRGTAKASAALSLNRACISVGFTARGI